MNKFSAVIIKGNPKFIENNIEADNFYKEIKDFLETLNYEVSFDKGEPYTSPKKADLWIGHSRGVDRLRFAHKDIYTLMFGSSHKDSVNHQDDNSVKTEYTSNVIPNKFHYKFTNEMRNSILEATKKIESKV